MPLATTPSFWDSLMKRAPAIDAEFKEAWNTAECQILSKEQALQILDLLWQKSHLEIMRHLPEYTPYFPTKQRYLQRLAKTPTLWWLDHATAGVNGWGTIKWFSSKPQTHVLSAKTEQEALFLQKRYNATVVKEGAQRWKISWTGLAGASTHFVVFADGTPFYLVDINDGAWGEPKRNGDAIQVEMVNALVVTPGAPWNFWAGPIPEAVYTVQSPRHVKPAFRGANWMLPYTWEQACTNIKLKRLCIAATGRMSPSRMSQHTDWNEKKYDMGPLWPFKEINEAAFGRYPVRAYIALAGQLCRSSRSPDSKENLQPEQTRQAIQPGVLHDLNNLDLSEVTTKELQQQLQRLYGPQLLSKYGADGNLGKETTTAVRRFQIDWNRNHPEDPLTTDGIPGVKTSARLQKALLAGAAFKKTYVQTV